MKKEDFIALGLDEEKALLCESKSLEELESYILKEDYENTNNTINTLKEEVTKLQNDNKNNEKRYLKEVNDLKLDYAINDAIKNAKGRNHKAIRALLNLENIKVNEDGNIDGLDEQINTLVSDDSSSFLFLNESNGKNKEKFKGVEPIQSNVEGIPKTDLSKMSYSEYVQYLNQNPQAN